MLGHAWRQGDRHSQRRSDSLSWLRRGRPILSIEVANEAGIIRVRVPPWLGKRGVRRPRGRRNEVVGRPRRRRNQVALPTHKPSGAAWDDLVKVATGANHWGCPSRTPGSQRGDGRPNRNPVRQQADYQEAEQTKDRAKRDGLRDIAVLLARHQGCDIRTDRINDENSRPPVVGHAVALRLRPQA
jgi:hypothetical protein